MALSHSEISKIVESILAGDKNQFRIIIHEYELMVRSYLATKLYKQDKVDDLAQETFITAYKKLSAFDTEKSIQSWLFGIAHNHLRNYFKTTKRRTNAMDNFREHIFSSIDEELVQASENIKDEQMIYGLVDFLVYFGRSGHHIGGVAFCHQSVLQNFAPACFVVYN